MLPQLFVHDLPALRLVLLLVGEFAAVTFVHHAQLSLEVVHLGASRLPERQDNYLDDITKR